MKTIFTMISLIVYIWSLSKTISPGCPMNAGIHICNVTARLSCKCCNAKSTSSGLLQIWYKSQGIKLCNLPFFD